MPASASYIGSPTCTTCPPNPLKVDIDGGGVSTPKAGWQQWLFQSNWTGPVTKQFNNPLAEYPREQPIAQLEVYRPNGSPNEAGLSRNRGGGFAGVAGTGDYSRSTQGWGMSYVKLTLTNLEPGVNYEIELWGYELAGVWSNGTDNPAKYVAWSTTNPRAWCLANGYDGSNPGEPPQGGYGPIPGSADSNMPAGLKVLVGAQARACLSSPYSVEQDLLGSDVCKATVRATAQGQNGVITLYGWMDGVKVWGGSNHLPLNGFLVVPEPATIALLGLGGLALLRKCRK